MAALGHQSVLFLLWGKVATPHPTNDHSRGALPVTFIGPCHKITTQLGLHMEAQDGHSRCNRGSVADGGKPRARKTEGFRSGLRGIGRAVCGGASGWNSRGLRIRTEEHRQICTWENFPSTLPVSDLSLWGPSPCLRSPQMNPHKVKMQTKQQQRAEWAPFQTQTTLCCQRPRCPHCQLSRHTNSSDSPSWQESRHDPVGQGV